MEQELLDKILLAGKITAEVREDSRKLIKVGASLLDIAEKIEAEIRKKGAEPAFPVNLSINDAAAHYTPTAGDKTVIKENDIIKVDIGVHVDGYAGDTAYTISFNPELQELVKASEQALAAAMKEVRTGALLSNVSSAIQETIESFGFKPVSNLTGHGIEQYDLHADPQIPNVKFESDYTLEEDMLIAIEPFATNGAGRIMEANEAMIFGIGVQKPTRNMDARKIMEWSEQFNGMPFAERWLSQLKLSDFKIKLALRELRNLGVLHEYPVLKEVKKGMISQTEHTLIVKDKPIVTTL